MDVEAARTQAARLNADLQARREKFRADIQAWVAAGKDPKTRPEVPQEAKPVLPDRAARGLPPEPAKIYHMEPGPNGITRGAVFPSEGHIAGKAWFPEGVGEADIQQMAREMRASGPGKPMAEGSPARVWTSLQNGPKGPYPVVMIDDGNGGITLTPDLKAWELVPPPRPPP